MAHLTFKGQLANAIGNPYDLCSHIQQDRSKSR